MKKLFLNYLASFICIALAVIFKDIELTQDIRIVLSGVVLFSAFLIFCNQQKVLSEVYLKVYTTQEYKEIYMEANDLTVEPEADKLLEPYFNFDRKSKQTFLFSFFSVILIAFYPLTAVVLAAFLMSVFELLSVIYYINGNKKVIAQYED